MLLPVPALGVRHDLVEDLGDLLLGRHREDLGGRSEPDHLDDLVETGHPDHPGRPSAEAAEWRAS